MHASLYYEYGMMLCINTAVKIFYLLKLRVRVNSMFDGECRNSRSWIPDPDEEWSSIVIPLHALLHLHVVV
jgi:hypothetical protein